MGFLEEFSIEKEEKNKDEEINFTQNIELEVYRKKVDAIIEKQIEETEKFMKTGERLNNTFSDIKTTIQELIKNCNIVINNSNKKIIEVQEEKKKLKTTILILIIINLILAIITFFYINYSILKINNKVENMQNKTSNSVENIYDILSENKKFWYDEKNRIILFKKNDKKKKSK